MVGFSLMQYRWAETNEAWGSDKEWKNKDSLTIPLAINYEWVSNHFGDDTATEGARHFRNETREDNVSVCKTGRQTTIIGRERQNEGRVQQKKWRQPRGNRDLGCKLFIVQGLLCAEPLSNIYINLWEKMFNTSRQKYRLSRNAI